MFEFFSLRYNIINGFIGHAIDYEHVFFFVEQLQAYNCTWWCIDACKVQWVCITFCHTIPYCCYDDFLFSLYG
jgi:hypothetical protein